MHWDFIDDLWNAQSRKFVKLVAIMNVKAMRTWEAKTWFPCNAKMWSVDALTNNPLPHEVNPQNFLQIHGML
jgi:hypothetical protein